MPDQYSKPRLTVVYLLGQLRDRAPLPVLAFLLGFGVAAVVGTSTAGLGPLEAAALARMARGEPFSPGALAPRTRAAAFVALPAMRAAGLLVSAPADPDESVDEAAPGAPPGGRAAKPAAKPADEPDASAPAKPGPDRAVAVGATLMAALSLGMLAASLAAWIEALGLGAGAAILTVLLVLAASCLTPAAWELGPALGLATALAIALPAAGRFRRGGHPQSAALALVAIGAGACFEPGLALLLPVVVSASIPPGLESSRRTLFWASVVGALVGFGLWAGWGLGEAERGLLFQQAALRGVLRRALELTLAPGSGLVFLSPALVLAFFGVARARRTDPALVPLSLGGASVWLLYVGLTGRTLAEQALATGTGAPLVVLVTPLIACGLIEVAGFARGPGLIGLVLAAGLVANGLLAAFDPMPILVRLATGHEPGKVLVRVGREVWRLDRPLPGLDTRFLPELAGPALAFEALGTWCSPVPASDQLWIRFARLDGQADVWVRSEDLVPRSWVLRMLLRGPPGDPLGKGPWFLSWVAAAGTLAALWLGLACLGIRLYRLARRPG